MKQKAIDTGDSVYHRPTKETWLVAAVDGDRLYWCGWPPGFADLKDCELKEKASDEKRLKLLKEIASKSTNDARKALAIKSLEDETDLEIFGREGDGLEGKL